MMVLSMPCSTGESGEWLTVILCVSDVSYFSAGPERRLAMEWS